MSPDFKTFARIAKKHALVPIWKEVLSDLDTPVTVYLKLAAQSPYGILLESVEGGEKLGRYSFISVSHLLRFEVFNDEIKISQSEKTQTLRSSDPISELKKIFLKLNPATLPDLPRFCGGAVGMAGYDMVRSFEKLPDLLQDDLNVPTALFLFTDECVIFDHWQHRMMLIKWNLIDDWSLAGLKKVYQNAERHLDSLAKQIQKSNLGSSGSGISYISYNKTMDSSRLWRDGNDNKEKRGNENIEVPFTSNFTKRGFCQAVQKAKEYISAGDIIQTVLSQRFEIEAKVSPFQVYRALRQVNPSPYLYFLHMNHFSLVGSSPEILVRKEGPIAITRPIAGTRPRGKNEQEDLLLEKELLNDPKEKAEHLMLVDLGRNDIGRCCKPGSVNVPEFMNVQRYSHVMHLESTVQGTLKNNEDAFSLFRACFPAGTVSGAPKIRAMEIIEELEKQRRSTYAGSVGYFSYSGNMDMAITIRTLLFKDKKIYLQAGAGIVADSVPELEERESRSKAAALFKAVQLAQTARVW